MGAGIGLLAGLNPVSSGIIGGVIGNIGANKAEKLIKEEINKIITKQTENANNKIRQIIDSKIAPTISGVESVKNRLLNTTIPLINKSVTQIMNYANMSLDVRSSTTNNTVTTVVTTRFSPTSGQDYIKGSIRFPKTRCVYGSASTDATSPVAYSIPVRVDSANDSLAGQSCSSLINNTQIVVATYLGENPGTFLPSSKPEDNMQIWKAMGSVQGLGTVIDKGSHYECKYQISQLPKASILDIGVVLNSKLADSLPDYLFRARYALINENGLTVLLDYKGKPASKESLNFGGAGPKELGECTVHSYTHKIQFETDFHGEIEKMMDPNWCPTCGSYRFWSYDERIRPNFTPDENFVPVSWLMKLKRLSVSIHPTENQFNILPYIPSIKIPVNEMPVKHINHTVVQ